MKTNRGGPRSESPVWATFPARYRRKPRQALEALKRLPKSRQFGTPAGKSMALAIVAGKAVDMRKLTHFFPRWYSRIVARRGLTPMDDKIVGAAWLWADLDGYEYAKSIVAKADMRR